MMSRDTQNTREQANGRAAASFLVRFWQSPGSGLGQESLQGHVRHLQTGEELYINDPQGLTEVVLRELLSEQQEEAASSRLSPWETAFAQARS